MEAKERDARVDGKFGTQAHHLLTGREPHAILFTCDVKGVGLRVVFVLLCLYVSFSCVCFLLFLLWEEGQGGAGMSVTEARSSFGENGDGVGWKGPGRRRETGTRGEIVRRWSWLCSWELRARIGRARAAPAVW